MKDGDIVKYPRPYIEYLIYFHGLRDYFECHEVLEEHWKQDKVGERQAYWVALIQVAVGFYHHRLNNFNGAERMIGNALQLIQQEQQAITELGIDYDKMLEALQHELTAIRTKQPYSSIELPLIDDQLKEYCKKKCLELDCMWARESDLTDEAIIRKHALRDRSDVITQRKKQLHERQKRREASS